jgi:hypothetical protein
MWQNIDKETYMQKVKGLKPIESFTDPDGTMEFSCGRPQIVTIWGTVGTNEEENTPIVKCEMRKESRHQLEWDTEYSEYVNPASGKSGINHMFDPNTATQAEGQPATNDAVQATEQEAQEQAMESEETEG